MTELRLLETVSLPFEAEHLQQVLAAKGIEVFVEGVHSSNTFGMNALMGAIKIKVREEDLPSARQALSELHNNSGTAWYCGACQETNEPSFDYCWKCGGQRSDVEAEPPTASRGGADVDVTDFRSQHPSQANFNPSPYAPPQTESTTDLPSEESSEYEELVNRAYRASIIGLVTLPVVLHLYSCLLIISAVGLRIGLRAHYSARTHWRFILANLINVVVLLVAIAIGVAISQSW